MSEINSSIGVSNVRPPVSGQTGSSSFAGEASATKDRLSDLRGQLGTADSASEGISFTPAQQAPNAADETLRSLVKDAEEGDPTSGEHAQILDLGYSPDQVDKWRAQGFSLSEIKDGTAEAVEQDKSGPKAAVVENSSSGEDGDAAVFASLGADTVNPDAQLKAKKPELAAADGEKNLKKTAAAATPDSDSESASIADA